MPNKIYNTTACAQQSLFSIGHSVFTGYRRKIGQVEFSIIIVRCCLFGHSLHTRSYTCSSKASWKKFSTEMFFSAVWSEGVDGGWQTGGREHLKDLQKNSSEENESSARKRSQAAITTACCGDGGDNTHSGVSRKLALWTSAHPVHHHLKPKTLTPFKGGLPQVRQRSCTGRSWEVHNAIRTSHLMVRLLDFCVCVSLSFPF